MKDPALPRYAPKSTFHITHTRPSTAPTARWRQRWGAEPEFCLILNAQLDKKSNKSQKCLISRGRATSKSNKTRRFSAFGTLQSRGRHVAGAAARTRHEGPAVAGRRGTGCCRNAESAGGALRRPKLGARPAAPSAIEAAAAIRQRRGANPELCLILNARLSKKSNKTGFCAILRVEMPEKSNTTRPQSANRVVNGRDASPCAWHNAAGTSGRALRRARSCSGSCVRPCSPRAARPTPAVLWCHGWRCGPSPFR